MLIRAGGYTPEDAEATVAQGLADAVAFGRLFIVNPDLPERLRLGAELNPGSLDVLWRDGEGYTDDPELEEDLEGR